MMATEYYYLLFLLWFLSSLTFLLDNHVVFLRVKILLLLGDIHSFAYSTNAWAFHS
ncbi:hypothetical protein JHK82_053611 [Glycine max]|uniref:Uncharacterized protein n=2 Tax=Glycine subgen. Soja TaxID=1462606 RepID=K7MYE7_SOYBN|nr:hypothetical protein JHK86_053460 [Glycine max]KAG4915974.1 hypothetical protein JHK87_053531 [Glycine soja]KAG4927920.1 hypothetical protein JHK85_054406 [Glycine max]KAG5083443.1 hypothetical protein JHK84_053481 [Glycine max]KAG5086214.1 hypothetical protein JHK82_053611 [Glycine max]